MVLPPLHSDPTAFPRVGQAQALTTVTCVHEARAHLHTTGETAAVVYRSGRPVGVVTAAAVEQAAQAGRASAPITTVMDYVVVPVTANAAHARVRTST